MQIIIPMAGMGKRMRPHTLTVPKPLIPIAGKPIVQRLVEDIAKVCQQQIDEIAFIISHNFDPSVHQNLLDIAKSVGAQGHICYQDEALGTAHAILCAEKYLKNNVVVAFADTLFKADFSLDTSVEGTIWVQKVADPAAFGVVKVNENNEITDFVEKPKQFVSDLAIIGIYYFKDGDYLKKELQYLIENNITDKGEYQLTNALENMKNKGTKFVAAQVSEWLDCGNKDATIFTNQRYLEYLQERKEKLVANTAHLANSVIIPPVFIGENVKITNSVIGPHVSVGQNTQIDNSVIQNALIQGDSQLNNLNISNSMIGNFVIVKGSKRSLNLGDYSTSQD